MKMKADGIREYILGKLAKAQFNLDVAEEQQGTASKRYHYMQGYVQALEDVLSSIR